MAELGWLTQTLDDVPPGLEWLTTAELDELATVVGSEAQREWKVRWWTAKRLVAHWCRAPVERVEVRSADDGDLDPFIEGRPANVSVCASDRNGRALAVVAGANLSLGCDLEIIEPRDEAFVADLLTPSEKEYVAMLVGEGRDRVVNLLWCVKEAAAKARGPGAARSMRNAAAVLEGFGERSERWRPLRLEWGGEDVVTHGWWREEPDWLMAIASEPRGREPLLITRDQT